MPSEIAPWEPAGMPELRDHEGHLFAVQYCYSVPDGAWHIELSEAVPAPESWATLPNAPTHLPGPAIILAAVPDEDPSEQPTIHLYSGVDRAIPYEIAQWFMEKVTESVETYGH
jgi:hypothetical protein